MSNITTLTSLQIQSLKNTDSGKTGAATLFLGHMTQAQRDALSPLVLKAGAIIYNTDSEKVEVFQSNGMDLNWVSVGGGGAGDGDVVGPEGAVKNNVVIFSDDTGKLIADSNIAVDNIVTAANNGIQNNIVKFADNNKTIVDSGVGIDQVNAFNISHVSSVPNPIVNQISNIGNIQFSNGLGVVLVDDLIPVEFIKNRYGSGSGDVQISALFTGDLPGSSTTPSALVELQSTTGAFVFSRMNTNERNALTAPTNGMVLYNTDTNNLNLYSQNQWNNVGGGTGTVTSVGITGSTGLNVSNSPVTTSGTIALNLSNELQSISQLNNTGLIVRTGSATYNPISITAGSPNVLVINGSGVNGNPVIDLNSNITLDRITLNNSPTTSTDATNKGYVDSIASGFKFKTPCKVATTDNLNATYNNGSSGVGATLTNQGTLAALVVDDTILNVGDRVLVKNQTTQAQNGIYTVTVLGSGQQAWVLTRASDFDISTEIVVGAFVPITQGVVNQNTTWLNNSTVTNIGTDPITLLQFSYGPSAFLQVANNLSDLTNVQTAINNLGLSNVTYSSISNPATLGHIAFSNNAQGTDLIGSYNGANVYADNTGKLTLRGNEIVFNGNGNGISTLDGLNFRNNNQILSIGVNALSGSYGIRLPNQAPTLNQILLSDANGQLSWVERGVTSVGVTGSTGLNVSNSPITTNGNISLSLNNELTALAQPIGAGFVSRIGSGIYAQRSITAGSSGNVKVIDGDGINANPVIDLSNTPIFNKITINNTPVANTDATNKEYVDAIAAGIAFKNPCRVATTSNLTATYNNGTAGVGATLTSATTGALVVDGVTLSLNERVLVKNQTTQAQNGIYVLTTRGNTGTAWVLTRASDYDQIPEIAAGNLVFIEEGTLNTNTSWIESSIVTTIGTSPITFNQFSYGPGAFLQVANNLSDLSNVQTAINNLGLSKVTYADISNPAQTGYIAFSNNAQGTDLVGSYNGANAYADNNGKLAVRGNEITLNGNGSGVSLLDRLNFSNNQHKLSLGVSGLGTDYDINLPNQAPSINQILLSDANGQLSWVERGVTSIGITGSTGLIVTDSPVTTNGNISLRLNSELTALAQPVGTGIISRTATDTYNQRSITAGSSGNVTILDGDGVAGNPIIDLSTAPVFNSVTINNSPTSTTHAVTKGYVDNVVAGFKFKTPCKVATIANLSGVYDNGTFGVGATLTSSTTGVLVVDGVTLSLNERVLVKNQTVGVQNGIYVVTTVGDESNNWVLTRSTDFNTPSDIANAFIPIVVGTVNTSTTWLETSVVTQIGTDSIVLIQFSYGPDAFLEVSNNLSDLSNVQSAINNLGLSNVTYADISNPAQAGYIAFSNNAQGTDLVGSYNGASIYADVAGKLTLLGKGVDLNGNGFGTNILDGLHFQSNENVLSFGVSGLGATYSINLPISAPTINQILLSDANGQLSWVERGVTSVGIAGSTGLIVADSPITTNGNISLSLNSELTALAQPVGTGIISRTGSGTYEQRSITAGDNVTVVDGNGVNGNPIISINSTPAFNSITINNAPVNSTDATNKGYVDSIATGFKFKDPCKASTTSNLTATYNNGTSGVGATLTNADTQAALVLDGVTLSVNDRVLIKDQTTQAQNGIYVVTTVGDGSTNWVLTRSTDFDNISEVVPGSFVIIEAGTTNIGTSWLDNITVTNIGTDPITFIQFSYGPGAFLQAANNLSDLTNVSTAWTNLNLSTTITSSTTGLGVSGGPIVGNGTIDLSLNNELQNISQLSTTGLVVRSGTATYSPVAITAGTSGNVTVVDGDGVSGNPTIDLITSPTFNSITISNAPVNPTDGVNKAYVDAGTSESIYFKTPCKVATIANLTATYNNGTSGVGATLTNADTQAALVLDGVTLSVNDRVLIKDQTTQAQNGIYVVTTVGDGSTNWVLTRSTDFNQASLMPLGATFVVALGIFNNGSIWSLESIITTVGTDSISIVEMTSSNAYSPGNPLFITTNGGEDQPVEVTNVYIGWNVGTLTTGNGWKNVGIGRDTLSNNTDGASNVAVGSNALHTNSIGSSNVAIGNASLLSTTNSNATVAVGALALADGNHTSTVAVGAGSGSLDSTYCTYLGAQAGSNLANITNACAIGYNTKVETNHAVVLGSGCRVGIGTSSPVYALHLDTDNSMSPAIYMASQPLPTPPASATGGIFSVNQGIASFTSGITSNDKHSGHLVTVKNTGTSSDTMGASTLNGTTGVTIATTAVNVNSVVIPVRNIGTGTTPANTGHLTVGNIIDNTSFTVFSDNASDTSNFTWLVINY